MKKNNILKLAVIFVSIGILFQCQKNPIPYDLSDPDFTIDTLTINKITGTTYFSPPLMGNTTGLYFGDAKGFTNKYSLIRYSAISVSGSFYTYDLIDENLTVDSLLFTFCATDTVIPTDAVFELYYFPEAGDSLFSEDESNYLNFPDENIDKAIKIGETSFILDESDTTLSEYPQLQFKIKDADLISDLIEFISDTADVENRSFMLRNVDTINEIISVSSRQMDSEYPKLLAYYTIDDDDYYSIFYPLQDVTIVVPREITDFDKNNISVGRAAGLKSIIWFDFSDIPQDSNTVVIKDADLFFNSTSLDSLDDFYIRAVVLADSTGESGYHELEVDDYEIEDEYITGSFDYNEFEIEIRSYLQGIITGSYHNFGLIFYSYIYNPDHYKTVNLLIDPEDPSTYPYLRIAYVKL